MKKEKASVTVSENPKISEEQAFGAALVPEWRKQQRLDLIEALAAADRGEFASEEEVEEFFRQHGA